VATTRGGASRRAGGGRVRRGRQQKEEVQEILTRLHEIGLAAVVVVVVWGVMLRVVCRSCYACLLACVYRGAIREDRLSPSPPFVSQERALFLYPLPYLVRLAPGRESTGCRAEQARASGDRRGPCRRRRRQCSPFVRSGGGGGGDPCVRGERVRTGQVRSGEGEGGGRGEEWLVEE
jgi:hypothetical protein